MMSGSTMRTACAVSLSACSVAIAAGGTSVQIAPVDAEGRFVATTAIASAIDRVTVTPRFHIDAFMADDILRPPMHPPIDQIEALEMPNPDLTPQVRGSGPGNLLSYDVGTQTVTEYSGLGAGISSGAVDNGFAGVNSFAEYEDMFATRGFGTMSLIADATRANSPWRQNAKLVMEYVDAGNGSTIYRVCSGAMQDAEVVLTAGHCVYRRDDDSTGTDYGFADRIWVYPGWDGDGLTLGTPGVLDHYGWAVSETYEAWTGYTQNGNFDWDMGLIRVNRAVGMLTGWYAYAWGGDCTGRSYNVSSYPSEGCGTPGLHNGRDMYYWFGTFDSCPGNQMHIDTTPGCLTALWGGQSGSNVYYRSDDGNTRYAHGVASNSNRTTSGNYTKMWEGFKDSMLVFEENARTSNFDLQALQVRVTPTTILAGQATTTANAQVPNPTNANPGSTSYGFNMYLSTNNNISTSDTLLADRQYSWDYAPMQNLTLNTGNVTIPKNTPSGTYWVGMVLDSQDAISGNNDSDLWDAQEITVNGIADIVANSASVPNGTHFHGDSVAVSYSVENEGGDPSNSVTLTFYASTNTDLSIIDTPLGSVNIGTFAGSQVKNGTFNVSIPDGLAPGSYYIGYIASASDDYYVNQSNEAYDAVPVTVAGRADLFANYFTSLDDQTGVGGEIDVRFNVQNLGTIASGAHDVSVYASTNSIISPADTLLRVIPRPSLNAGNGSTLITPVNIPLFMSPGNYYVGMIVETGTNENVAANNSAFDTTPVLFTDCTGDLNNDGTYDLTDIGLFVNSFTATTPLSDLNNDGTHDLTDIGLFVDAFNAGCP